MTLIEGEQKLIRCLGCTDHEDRYELYDLANYAKGVEDEYRSVEPVAGALQVELRERLGALNQPFTAGRG